MTILYRLPVPTEKVVKELVALAANQQRISVPGAKAQAEIIRVVLRKVREVNAKLLWRWVGESFELQVSGANGFYPYVLLATAVLVALLGNEGLDVADVSEGTMATRLRITIVP